MVQKEDPQKKAVLPESVPNDDLDLLYLASLSAPLMISPLTLPLLFEPLDDFCKQTQKCGCWWQGGARRRLGGHLTETPKVGSQRQREFSFLAAI